MYLSRVIKMVFLMSLLALLVPASLARGQIMGTAVIRSSSPGLSDQLVVNLVDVSILGTDEVYEGWLVSDDGSDNLSVGVMAVDADGGISHTYTNADGLNLSAKYDTFKITVEPVPDTDTGPSTHTAYSDQITADGMTHIRRLLSKPSASGSGVNLKMMPDKDGNPTVGMDEVFGFSATHAFCKVDNNPVGFMMPTFGMGDVFIDANTFFMEMTATNITSIEVTTLADGSRQLIMKGDFGCATEAGVGGATIGDRNNYEPATFEITAIDGGAGNENDSFVFKVWFDETIAPINYAIFGPTFDFTGEMTSGDVTILDPAVYDTGITAKLWQQADVAHQQSTLGVNADTLSDVQTYAHAVINVIEGSRGANYDASFGDPGDGHGVLNHAASTKDHAGRAATAVPSDSTIVKYNSNVSDSSDNVVTWSGEARNHALDAISATSMTVAKAYMTNANTLIARSRDGYDADRDDTIESITGEGGALQVHVAAQDMGTYHPFTFVPAPAATPAATPAPAPEPVAAPETGGISLTTYAWIALASSFFLIIGGSYLLRRRSTN